MFVSDTSTRYVVRFPSFDGEVELPRFTWADSSKAMVFLPR